MPNTPLSNTLAAAAAADAPLPVEAGDGTLTASVNGTVQMK